MKHYVQTDETGRILVTVEDAAYTDETYSEFDFPEDFDFGEQSDYRIVDGALVHEVAPPSEEEIAQQQERQRREQLQAATLLLVRSSAATLSDGDALSVSLLFEEWTERGHYAKGDVLRYGDGIYRCLQGHDGQASWTPDQAHSLWVRIRPEGEVSEWKQVVPGVDEPYKEGDKVTHNGKTWVSDVNGNVWEPGVYGWSEIGQMAV